MISVYIYFFCSLVSFYMFLFFLHLHKKNDNDFIFYYSTIFLFTFFMCFFDSVPILSGMGLRVAAWGNVLSNISVFGIIVSCFRVQILVTDKFFKKHLLFFDMLTFIIAIIAVGFQIANLANPIVHTVGVIWNFNPVTSVLLSGSGFVYGMYWAWLFGRVAHLLKEIPLKKRMYMLCANGILDGIAALFGFSNNQINIIIGMTLVFIGILISMVVFTIPENVIQSSEPALSM